MGRCCDGCVHVDLTPTTKARRSSGAASTAIPGTLYLIDKHPAHLLRHGLEAGDLDPESEAAIESHRRTGRPWGSAAFVERLEHSTGRRLRGKSRVAKPDRNRYSVPGIPGIVSPEFLVSPEFPARL